MCHLLFSEGNHLLRTRKKRYIKSYHCGQRVRFPKGLVTTKVKKVLTAIEDTGIFPDIPVSLLSLLRRPRD